MILRATYAAATGLTAEIVLFTGAHPTVIAYLDDHDGTPVQRWDRTGCTEADARTVAGWYHDRLVRRWGMALLWHSGPAQTTPRAA